MLSCLQIFCLHCDFWLGCSKFFVLFFLFFLLSSSSVCSSCSSKCCEQMAVFMNRWWYFTKVLYFFFPVCLFKKLKSFFFSFSLRAKLKGFSFFRVISYFPGKIMSSGFHLPLKTEQNAQESFFVFPKIKILSLRIFFKAGVQFFF